MVLFHFEKQPHMHVLYLRHIFHAIFDQLLQYGDARALAAREQAIEEWRVHLLALWEKGDFDLKDALAASPQEQT